MISSPSSLSYEQRQQLASLLEQELQRRQQRTRLYELYPDEGPVRRELYPRHMEFFRAGATYRERCFMAANRVGKTWGAGGYEVALHLLGEYPDWWEGRRFECPVDAWAAGKTNESTRDIVQTALLGPANAIGTGLIPGDRILKSTPKTGVPGLLDTVYVQSRYGVSALGVKSYQQGRDAFEGTSRHVIWLDEEPPLDVYGECLIRTATTDGMVLLTFTPLEGLSQVVLSFLPQGWAPGSA